MDGKIPVPLQWGVVHHWVRDTDSDNEAMMEYDCLAVSLFCKRDAKPLFSSLWHIFCCSVVGFTNAGGVFISATFHYDWVWGRWCEPGSEWGKVLCAGWVMLYLLMVSFVCYTIYKWSTNIHTVILIHIQQLREDNDIGRKRFRYWSGKNNMFSNYINITSRAVCSINHSCVRYLNILKLSMCHSWLSGTENLVFDNR